MVNRVVWSWMCVCLAETGGDVKCWQRSGLPCLDAPSVGSALAVETGGSLFCSAALKSCNDRFSAVFSRTRGPVIRAPFPTRSIPIDPRELGGVYVRTRVCVCVLGGRALGLGIVARERALWQTDEKKLLIFGRTKKMWQSSSLGAFELGGVSDRSLIT